MASVRTENSLLLLHFRQFYSEVLQIKLRLEYADADQENQSTASLPNAPVSSALAVNDVWHGLLRLLDMQGVESSRAGGAFTFEVYREAQYVMAALADEIFLNCNWPGRDSGPLLENKLFHSHASGEVFFQRIDRLLGANDRGHNDLAMIYFQALALGFRGKYRDQDERGELDQYRRRLFIHIYRRPPQNLAREQSIFPQSYLPTLAEGDGRRLPNPQTWLRVRVGIGVLWMGGSWILWHHLTADMYALIHSIQTAPAARWNGHP